MKKFFQNQEGFSMMELLAAIVLLSMGVVTIAGLINSTLSSSRTMEERLIAVNLAQEGVEIIRNIRDTSWLDGHKWDDQLKDSGCNANANPQCPFIATVDYDSTSINITSNPNNWKMIWNGTYYKHNIAGSLFSRHIELDYDKDSDGDTALRVKSIVEWRNESFEIEEWLYEWQ